MNLGAAVLGRLLRQLSQCNVPRCADHADNKERHARVVDLFFVTVDHRLRRIERVDRLSSLTASVALVRETRQQPESVRSRPGRLLLVRIWCQALA